MRMTILDLRLLAKRGHDLSQDIAVHRTIELADEQRRVGVFAIFARREIQPQGAPNGLAQKDCAPFPAFGTAQTTMLDLHLARFLIDVSDLERTQLGGAQARVEQGQDDRAIALGGRSAHGEAVYCRQILEEVAVAVEGVRAKPFGGFVLQEARNSLRKRQRTRRSTIHCKTLLWGRAGELQTYGLTKTP